jgi:hypothetical protein
LSPVVLVGSILSVASSLIRSRIFPTAFNTPSWVCRNDTVLATLVAVAAERLAAADNFIETARPPASSDGFTIFDPLESRLRLRCRLLLEAARLLEAVVAAELVLITTDMVVSFLVSDAALRSRHGS